MPKQRNKAKLDQLSVFYVNVDDFLGSYHLAVKKSITLDCVGKGFLWAISLCVSNWVHKCDGTLQNTKKIHLKKLQNK